MNVMRPGEDSPEPVSVSSNAARSSSWMPHLWVLVVPVGAVAVAYALYFLFIALFRVPDWLARIVR